MSAILTAINVNHLHRAARSGDLPLARKLLITGPGRYHVNCMDSMKQTPLFYACNGGHLEMVQMLIREFEADTAVQDVNGRTAIMVATLAGHSNVVKVLSEVSPLVDGNGRTVLYYACARGNTSMIKTIVSEVGLKYLENHQITALSLAFQSCDKEAVLFLISEFCCEGIESTSSDDEMVVSVPSDIVNARGPQGRSLLHTACSEGNTKLVQALVLRYKADLSARDDNSDTPLHVAALHGKIDVVMVLVDKFGCDVNVIGHQGRTILHCACQGGHISLIKTLILEYKADIDALDNLETSPLHVAAQHGQGEVVLTLINEFGCNPCSVGSLGRSLLHNACIGGSVSLVKTLICKYGADTMAPDKNANTPLELAVQYNHDNITLTLISEFACNADSIRDPMGRSLLHIACSSGNVNLTKELLARKMCDMHGRDNEGNTPLHLAAISGMNLEMLKAAANWDLTIKGFLNRTLLHCACLGGNIGMIRTLILEYGADTKALDDEGNAPIHLAVLSGEEGVALEMLESFGCDHDMKGYLGRTLLHIACSVGNLSLVKTLLVTYEANVNARDDEQNTPLHVAAISGEEVMTIELIETFVDQGVKGYQGRSLLHSACSGGNVSLVETLILTYRENIDARDNDKNTPIHVVALSGRLEVILTLIGKLNCDPTVKGYQGRTLIHSACVGGNACLVNKICDSISPQKVDENGDTPLHVASALGHSECVKVLLSHEAPILKKNNLGLTPLDVATGEAKSLLEKSM